MTKLILRYHAEAYGQAINLTVEGESSHDLRYLIEDLFKQDGPLMSFAPIVADRVTSTGPTEIPVAAPKPDDNEPL